MKISVMLWYVVINISHRKLRSFLTILAIVFGIFTISTIVGISRGVDEEVNNKLQVFGAKTIFVAPVQGASVVQRANQLQPTSKFTMRDLETVKRIIEVDKASYTLMGRADVSYRGKRATALVVGSEPSVMVEINPALEIATGRALRDNDRGMVVVGSNFAENFFDSPIELNSRIFISGKPFQVVGIIKKSGLSAGGMNIDDLVVVHAEDARVLFGDLFSRDEITQMMLLIKEGYDVQEVAEKIEDSLRLQRKIGRNEKSDFTVLTAATVKKQVEDITRNLTLFLGAIGMISLIVGGLGIANTMFTAILERTQEIGILKAIGASNRDVLSIFLMESSLIACVGGMIGFLLSLIVGLVIQKFDIPYVISFDQLAVSILFSVVVGAVAGYIPARKAANLEPVTALRSV